MGQVLQGGAGQAPARQAAIAAGLPIEVPADTINKVCASSIRAVEIADAMIRAGDAEVVVTGGMESMSNAPYALEKARFGYRLGDGTLIDLMAHDGLTSSFDGRHMVEQASFVARELGISREEQDAWALRSHERAVAAMDDGPLRPTRSCRSATSPSTRARAATPRSRSSRAQAGLRSRGHDDRRQRARRERRRELRRRRSEEFAERRGLEPLATIVAQGYVADEFAYLARTPAKAGAIALAKAGKTIDDVERVEMNEAFSSVALNSTKLLGADPETVNVNGGAVALGHPIGASGARILGDDDPRAAPQRRRPRPRRDLLRRRPGRRDAPRGLPHPPPPPTPPAPALRLSPLYVRFEHVLVVGAGQMGGGIAQVIAASGRRVSLYDAAPGAVERGLETMRRSLAKLAEKGGPTPTRCSCGSAGGRPRARRPDGRGGGRGRRGQGGRLPPRRPDAAAGGRARLEHVLDPDLHPRRVDRRPDRVIGMHFFNPVPVL